MIIKSNYYTTITEMKAILNEEKTWVLEWMEIVLILRKDFRNT